MAQLLHRAVRGSEFAAVVWAMLFASAAYATDARQASATTQDELWQRGVDLLGKGDFKGAGETIRKISSGGHITDQVRAWLEKYEAKQDRRRQLDREDFDKYVGYAKARIERQEYRHALDWTLFAADCAEDREAFLNSPWLHQLVNDALAAAEEYRQKADWRKAWHVYSGLAVLYDREPRYRKLEHEIETLLRLDMMFKEENNWQERLERVRWDDAEEALEHTELWYVERPDFKHIAESGLEQLLLLAESKTAQEQFEGLGNEFDRMDFENRVRERLDQVREAPALSRRQAVEIFRRVVKKINDQTVRLPSELIVSELMRGALEPLDDYTTMIWPLDAQEFDKHTRGDFIGVGISIIKNGLGETEVVTPLEDTPAFRAGIQAGDIIMEVNGKSLKGFSLNKVVDTITGPKNTMVTLRVRRGQEDLRFELERTMVKIQSVKGVKRDEDDEWNHWLDRELGIGYVRITNFQRNTVEDVANVLSELEAGGLKGLVLDLRANPGGLLETAYRISSLFLERDDTVVSTKGRSRQENSSFAVRADGPWSDLPITVLVDENSASASEIVAGAVRDNHHGKVIGMRTFGKFSVQNLIALSRSRAKLKLTTARYYLPSGASFHREPNSTKWGVEPDIPIRFVQKEKINLWKMRREAERIGPPKPETEEEGEPSETEEPAKQDDGPAKAEEEPTSDNQTKTAGADEQTMAEGARETPADEESDDEKLPPLDQPDENNRPMEDFQLDTALLLMRVELLADSYPTLATADAGRPEPKTANP